MSLRLEKIVQSDEKLLIQRSREDSWQAICQLRLESLKQVNPKCRKVQRHENHPKKLGTTQLD